MGKTDDWYRSTDWDDAARAEFDQRLARARPGNRVQYRRIKGSVLLESADPDAREAGRRMLEANAADPDAAPFERTIALSVLGHRAHDAGRDDEAGRYLRLALERLASDPNGGSGMEGVWLAEILLARGSRAASSEAEQLLAAGTEGSILLVRDRFRMCIAGVRVAVALGDAGAAREWAEWALTLTGATHSGLSNHPTLGLFEADPTTVRWLEDIIRSAPSRP